MKEDVGFGAEGFVAEVCLPQGVCMCADARSTK